MPQYHIDLASGALRPIWSNPEYAGFLNTYYDATSEEDVITQTENGYQNSAGCPPTPQSIDSYEVEDLDEDGNAILTSKRHPDDPPYFEMSRAEYSADTQIVIFEASMTGIFKNGKLIWIARLD